MVVIKLGPEEKLEENQTMVAVRTQNKEEVLMDNQVDNTKNINQERFPVVKRKILESHREISGSKNEYKKECRRGACDCCNT